MRVWLVVSYEPLPKIDGDVRFLRYGMLGSLLAGLGHEVTLWTSTFDHVKKRQRASQSSSLALAPGFTAEMVFAPEYHTNRSAARWRHNRVLARTFAARAGDVPRPDVILACLHAVELSEQVARFAQARGIPLVIDVVDRWPDIYLTALPQALHGVGKVFLAPEYARSRRTLRAATAVTAVSETYLRWAHDLAGTRDMARDGVFPLSYPARSQSEVEEVRSRAPALSAQWQVRPDALLCVFLGMFAGSYDLETVVDAARALDSAGRTDVQIVLAGAGDKTSLLLARAHGLTNVVFTGWLDWQQSLALLSCAHVGLAAYTKRAFQSLPYKPFEYMANGLAILTSLPGELADLIEHEDIGLSYRAHDATSLAAALTWCADNRAAVAEMGVRSRALFDRKYSANTVYGGLADRLLSLATGAGRYERSQAATPS